MKINLPLILALATVPTLGADWPQFHGPDRDNRSHDTGLLKTWPEGGPERLWEANGIGQGYSTVAIVGGRIYTAGAIDGHCVLTSLDSQGNKVWTRKNGKAWSKRYPGTRSTPTITDGLLYHLSGIGKLVCLRASGGEPVWSVNILEKFHGRNITWGLAESPLVVGNLVICTPGGEETSIVALDRMTGEVAWKCTGARDKPGYASPILVEHQGLKLIVTAMSESIVGVRLSDGKLLWRHPHKVYADGAAPKDKTITLSKDLPTRTLGRTAAKLPILGFGGAALPRAWGSPLSTDARIELVRHAFKRGIRYFDTAGNYMESQPILGRALEPMRKDAFLVGKVETTDPAKVRGQVEKALGQLQTDYLDAILIHGTPGLEQMTVKRAMQVHAELLKLKDEKMAKHIGFSAHGYFGKALALVNSGGFDLCMLAAGYIPRGHNQVFSPRMLKLRDQCVAAAHERKMGLVAMKVIGSGLLGGWSKHAVKDFPEKRRRQLPSAAIRHVLDDKRFHLLCIGMRLQSDIEANLATFTGDTTCTRADRELLSDYGKLVMQSDPIKKMRID